MNVPNSRIPYIVTPRLRKNRKIENRWGLQYEISVQYAAFGRQCLPYMPTEPPASLSEEVVESEPLYVCKQCKDCFRFQSSLDDHSKRRSWIFGLWCHNCFRTVCTHITEIGSVCSICMRQDNEKRSYLRSRGFGHQRFQKWGAMKVFYNQCQLFEHMKLHNLCSIDVSDVMLMPLPADLSYNDWTLELELACEALMEYTFLLRVHVMDWLRLNKIENNWWKLIDDEDDNNMSNIVRGYKGRQMFKTLEKCEEDQNPNSEVSNITTHSLFMELIDSCFNDKDKNNHSTNAVSDKNVSENEDNPCVSTDIAFVDCGPISKCLEPEPSMSTIPRKQISVLKNSRRNIQNLHLTDKTAKRNCKKRKTMLIDTSLVETDVVPENTTMLKVGEKDLNKNTISKQSFKNSQQYRTEQSFVKESVGNSISKPIIETDIAKILNNPINIAVPFSAKNIKLHKTNSDYLGHGLQKSVGACGSEILPVQSSKKADVASIINDLSSQLILNNKVVLEQNSQKFITFCDEDVIMTEKKSNNSTLDKNSTDVGTLLQKKQVTGKFLIKGGKRYLIKHSEDIKKNLSNLPIMTNISKDTKLLISKQNIPTSSTTNSGEVKNTNMVQATSPQNDISLLTPSPSPSELSSSSSCGSHAKQIFKVKLRKVLPRLISLQKNSCEMISLVEEKGEKVYMNLKITDKAPKNIPHGICKDIPKCREEMIKEFYHMDNFELMARINHLQHVSEEIRKVMNFVTNNNDKEKLRSINALQRILQNCLRKCDQNVQNKKNDPMLSEWEWKKIDIYSHRCPLCRKTIKPRAYIAGFSKLPKDDDRYCFCYKYVCYKCLSYHGDSSCFSAHQNLHMQVEPYICPDCHINFINAKFLEIHIWTACFHTLKKRVFSCKVCKIDGFRDIESITIHFATMHSDKKVVCEMCCLVFSLYDDYMKHYAMVHMNMPKPKPIRLVINKLNNEIVRYENFIQYLVNSSAIEELIWYKCPLCPFATLEDTDMAMTFSTHLQQQHFKRLSEVISAEALEDIISKKKFGKTCISEGILDTVKNPPCEDGTVIPKIVNTRTISSEIFERGSHDADNTWSINSGGSTSTFAADVSSQVTQKVDLLPKILNVRSVAGLKTTVADNVATSTELLTDMKVKRDSQASSSEVIKCRNEKGELSCKDEKNVMMELDDIRSDIREKTKELEEPDKSNDELVASCAAEFEKSLQINDGHTNSSTESNAEISNSESAPKTSGRIKVIDIRKICMPNIKPFMDKSCDMQPNDENVASTLPKPPPLARIPQHILDCRKTEVADAARRTMNMKPLSRKAAKMRPRIAIIGPTDTQEGSIEFLCHICNKKINTSWPVVRTHFTENHFREYQLATPSLCLKKLPSDYKKYYQKYICNMKRKSNIALPTVKRKRRWTSKKSNTDTKDTSVPEIGLCVEKETAEDGEGNFKCKKCGQRCTDMSDLREHIAANHRLKGRYLICLECGENFVVAPSLQMHLKAFHGIDDPISHMSQNPSYSSDAIGDLEEERKTTEANQCHVCMAVFEDKAAVDKHLRVHGMAFLNRKRIEARNALKSPEKKPNAEDNKQSPQQITEQPRETVKRDKPVETILEKLNAAM
ncbi:uncharacterized protein LOC105188607 isoform X2 [Harpegnathos saltator]|uniref:uncharacterized protein LOC105188607 isoform X2 n=1 Tax=Harpegnathos saltator TaxID=610380 RepID=UPI0005906CEF|nr:uncharacterized protein LOC105188607 isoform X2 [Harpegnathos saltator]